MLERIALALESIEACIVPGRRKAGTIRLLWELAQINNKLDDILRRLEDETNRV